MFLRLSYALVIVLALHQNQSSASPLSLNDFDTVVNELVPGQDQAARQIEKALLSYALGLERAVSHKIAAQSEANKIIAQYGSYLDARITEYDVHAFYEDARDGKIPFFDFAHANQQGNSVVHIIGPRGSGQKDVIDILARGFIPVVRIDLGLPALPPLDEFKTRVIQETRAHSGKPFVLALENIDQIPRAYQAFVKDVIGRKAFTTPSGTGSFSLSDVLVITTRQFSEWSLNRAAVAGVEERESVRMPPGLEKSGPHNIDLTSLLDHMEPRSFDAWIKTVSPSDLAVWHGIPMNPRRSDSVITLNASIEEKVWGPRGTVYISLSTPYASDIAILRSVDRVAETLPIFSETALLDLRTTTSPGGNHGYLGMINDMLERRMSSLERAKLIGNQELYKWSTKALVNLIETIKSVPLEPGFETKVDSIRFGHGSGLGTGIDAGRIVVKLVGIPLNLDTSDSMKTSIALGTPEARTWPSREIRLDFIPNVKGEPRFEVLGGTKERLWYSARRGSGAPGTPVLCRGFL